MEPIQIIIALFSLFAYSRIILRFKDKKINNGEFIFWTFIWVGLIVFSLFPQILTLLTKPFGVGRPIDVLVYLGVIALFYLVFKLYVKVDETEKEITKIVRFNAINNAKNKSKKK